MCLLESPSSASEPSFVGALDLTEAIRLHGDGPDDLSFQVWVLSRVFSWTRRGLRRVHFHWNGLTCGELCMAGRVPITNVAAAGARPSQFRAVACADRGARYASRVSAVGVCHGGTAFQTGAVAQELESTVPLTHWSLAGAIHSCRSSLRFHWIPCVGFPSWFAIHRTLLLWFNDQTQCESFKQVAGTFAKSRAAPLPLSSDLLVGTVQDGFSFHYCVEFGYLFRVFCTHVSS